MFFDGVWNRMPGSAWAPAERATAVAAVAIESVARVVILTGDVLSVWVVGWIGKRKEWGRCLGEFLESRPRWRKRATVTTRLVGVLLSKDELVSLTSLGLSGQATGGVRASWETAIAPHAWSV